MIAIILNSGRGVRMGALTETRQKCMVELPNGETVLARQLRLLCQSGVRDFLITTGPYEDQLKACAAKTLPADCRVRYVRNAEYEHTNYIYSLYLAREALRGDALLLHGDLVFDAALPGAVLRDPRPRLVTVDPQKPLPEKDFKARIDAGRVAEISIHAFGEDCHALQPFYKLDAHLLDKWRERIRAFVERGETGCYAENALNELMPDVGLEPFDCSAHFVEEIDTPEDYQSVSEGIRQWDFANQRVESGKGAAARIPALLTSLGVRKPLLVCGGSYDLLPVQSVLADVPLARFSAFSPNPKYEEIVEGVQRFREEGCDGLLSIGGGSAMDVAKCIKLFAVLADGAHYLDQRAVYSPYPHIAVPTTAGSGSEATRFAVIYRDGVKQSVHHDCIFPEAAVLDEGLLATLPPYQRKACWLDACCHALESMWSVNANELSRAYASDALRLLLSAFDGYFAEGRHADEALQGAHLAGLAINVTQTTAAHAMCYKLTTLYHLAHGHAVALCLPALWQKLLDAGEAAPPETRAALTAIARAMNAPDERAALAQFRALLARLDLPAPACDATDLDALTASVNLTRLQNFPLALSADEIRAVYRTALGR